MPNVMDKIKKTDPTKKQRRTLASRALSGNKVLNRAGEEIGQVEEIMIDLPSGQVAYVAMSFGGLLRMGTKFFAVPWKVLTVDEDRKCFLLDIAKETLDTVSGFDPDHWPDEPAIGWIR
jgi:sporulation protein YlmC with PRC-barrel domain